MAKDDGIEVEGLDEALRIIEQLPTKAGLRVLAQSFNYGINLTLKQAKANALKVRDSGSLAKAIIKKSGFDKRRGRAHATVGIDGKAVFKVTRTHEDGSTSTVKAVPHKYAHLVEDGVAPHQVGKGSILKDNGVQTGRGHPGSPPHPLIRAAWDTTEKAVTQLVEDEFCKRAQAALDKLVT